MTSTAVLSLCPVSGCRALTSGGRCPIHAVADDARRHAKQRAHGRDTAHWRRLRKLCIELARGRCQLGLEGCDTLATSVHLDPELEGRHELATLADVVAACSSCHGRVDAPRASEGRAVGKISGVGSPPRPAPVSPDFRPFRTYSGSATEAGAG